MKYAIDLSCDVLRKMLDSKQQKKYDDMIEFFIEHHYDEDTPIEELMLDYVAKTWPAEYMFFVRKCAQEQHVVKLDARLRVELELLELTEKISKLRIALFPEPNETLSKLPKETLDRLIKQEQAMTKYWLILKDRLDKDFKESK